MKTRMRPAVFKILGLPAVVVLGWGGFGELLASETENFFFFLAMALKSKKSDRI